MTFTKVDNCKRELAFVYHKDGYTAKKLKWITSEVKSVIDEIADFWNIEEVLGM